MNDKAVIISIFRDSVITFQQASKASLEALEAFEQLPDKPNAEQSANANRLLKIMLLRALKVGVIFNANLKKLELLSSGN